jgi:hypothetical protein
MPPAIDEAEVHTGPAALTETDVELAQDALLRSLWKIARREVVHPGVEIRLAGRLSVAASPIEVDVLVDVESVNEEVLQRGLAARAGPRIESSRPSLDSRAVDDVVEPGHVDTTGAGLHDRPHQRVGPYRGRR